MSYEIALLLVLIVVFMVLFSTERIPADAVALAVLVVLVLTGLLPARQAFAGFGSDTVIMMLGLLILTSALWRTGVMDLAGRFIYRSTGNNERSMLLVVMTSVAGLSIFISNTASTAFFVPVVVGLAMRAKIGPGKLLLPLAFSAILVSSVSLISTSTNLVVSGLMTWYDMAPMGMFELAPVGVPIALVGLTYMFFLGRHLVPDRTEGALSRGFGVRPYLSEIVILPDSVLSGKTLAESALGRDLDLTVLRIVRDKSRTFVPRAETRLKTGDVLLVEGHTDEILKIKETAGISIKADVKLSDPTLEKADLGLVEVILLAKSPLIGRTLKGFGFRERYGLQVLGINRGGETLRRKLSELPLRIGDVLLIQGSFTNIRALERDHTFRILGAVGENRPNLRRAPLAVGIFAGVILLATVKVLTLPVAVLIGAFLVFVTRCVTPEEAYREIEWRVIVIIGSMLALGAAMDHTGAAEYVAGRIAYAGADLGPVWVLAAFFLITVLLTQPMSNQAAAVVVLPVAVQTALQLDLNPRTFAMTVALAASCSYLTPLEPSCVIVYGPGRYRFADFLKVGAPLTLLVLLIVIFLTPRIWPLHLGR